MKKYLFLLLFLLTFNACNSVPSDKEIQSSINKNVIFELIDTNAHASILNSHDNIMSLFIGKKKRANGEYEINYSHNGTVYYDITILRLDNGKWMMVRRDDRWKIK